MRISARRIHSVWRRPSYLPSPLLASCGVNRRYAGSDPASIDKLLNDIFPRGSESKKETQDERRATLENIFKQKPEQETRSIEDIDFKSIFEKPSPTTSSEPVSSLVPPRGPYFNYKFDLPNEAIEIDLLKKKFYPRKVVEWLNSANTVEGHYSKEGKWEEGKQLFDHHGDVINEFHGNIDPDSFRDMKEFEEYVEKQEGPRRSARDSSGVEVTQTKKAKRDKKMEPPKPRAKLSKDLMGKYRFGVTPEMLDQAQVDNKIRELLSYKYASNEEIYQYRVREAIHKYGKYPDDTGDTGVQVAVVTQRILRLSEHARNNNKDKTTKKKVIELVSRRRKLLKYLRRTNIEKYYQVVLDLNLREQIAA